jgi:hypothetical protein
VKIVINDTKVIKFRNERIEKRLFNYFQLDLLNIENISYDCLKFALYLTTDLTISIGSLLLRYERSGREEREGKRGRERERERERARNNSITNDSIPLPILTF